ncbi:hypothetical protein ACLB1S_06850 [Escherichia coli]
MSEDARWDHPKYRYSRDQTDAGSTLKADDSMTFANKISGNGTISIDSGTVALTGNNYAFSGYIDVASGAVAVISEDKNIGRADLDVDGKLQINANKDWVFDNDLQGRGIVEINMGNHEFSFDEFAYTDWFPGFTGVPEHDI